MSGSRAIGEIETALANLRKEEARLTEALSAATDRIAKARSEETTALRDLARFKLAASGNSLSARLDDASRQATEIMASRRTELTRFESDRSAKSKALSTLQANIAALRADLEK